MLELWSNNYSRITISVRSTTTGTGAQEYVKKWAREGDTSSSTLIFSPRVTFGFRPGRMLYRDFGPQTNMGYATVSASQLPMLINVMEKTYDQATNVKSLYIVDDKGALRCDREKLNACAHSIAIYNDRLVFQPGPVEGDRGSVTPGMLWSVSAGVIGMAKLEEFKFMLDTFKKQDQLAISMLAVITQGMLEIDSKLDHVEAKLNSIISAIKSNKWRPM